MNENDNNTQDQTEEVSTKSDQVNHQIQTVDEFGGLLFTWHNKQVATVKHFLEVPAGIEVQVGDKEQIILDGDILKGYKLGLELALYYLGSLPFAYTPEEVKDEQATAAEAQEGKIGNTPASSVH